MAIALVFEQSLPILVELLWKNAMRPALKIAPLDRYREIIQTQLVTSSVVMNQHPPSLVQLSKLPPGTYEETSATSVNVC